MARPTPEGFKRPERVTHEPKVFGERVKLTDPGVLDKISGKHIVALQNRQNDCCKETANIEVEYLITNPAFDKPDMMVMHCTKCKAKHRISVASAGRMAG